MLSAVEGLCFDSMLQSNSDTKEGMRLAAEYSRAHSFLSLNQKTLINIEAAHEGELHVDQSESSSAPALVKNSTGRKGKKKQPLSESEQQSDTAPADSEETVKSQECADETSQGCTQPILPTFSTDAITTRSPEAMQMEILHLVRRYIDYLEVFDVSSSMECLNLGMFTEFLDMSIFHRLAFESEEIHFSLHVLVIKFHLYSRTP